MKKTQWNENEIKSLFSQLPRVTDQRDPQDIYEKVVATKREKRPNRWLIASASTAAICLFAFFASTFVLHNLDSSKDEASNAKQTAFDSTSKQNSEELVSMDNTNEKKESVEEDKADKSSLEAPLDENRVQAPVAERTAIAGTSSSLLYSNNQNEFMTVGVPLTENELVLPVTIEVQGTTNELSDVVQQIETILNEESFDLQFNLVNWKSTLDTMKHTVNVTFSPQGKNSVDDQLLEAVEETYRYQPIEKVMLYTNEQKGVTFSNAGKLEEIKIDPTPQRAIYMIQDEQTLESFFVPSNDSFLDITEALNVMKVAGPAPALKASIPKEINWNKIVAKGDSLIISFADGTKLENNQVYENVIKAILLTAREFGYKTIRFENSQIDKIGSMNLQEEMVVPIAPNLITS